MPTKAPVYRAPPPVVYNWTGFYVGANGGGGWGTSSWSYVVGGTTANHNNSGGLIGGTVGFNYQFAPNWVAGIEADWGWSNIRGSASCPNAAFDCKTSIDSLGTARGRIGYAMNQWLLYGTGGIAWGQVNVETVNLAGTATPTSGTATNGTKSTVTGWTVGAGVEYGFWTNWSAKIEYLYIDLGSHRYTVDNSLQVDSRQRESIVRVGVNYRFSGLFR
jgi:outer membrane immunogenic protein